MKGEGNKKCIANFIRFIALVVLLSLFFYWTISAWNKYLDEPIATQIQFRYGDDDFGNISMPVISFCQLPPLKYCNKTGFPTYKNALDCIASLGNVTKFEESLKVGAFKYRPFKCMFISLTLVKYVYLVLFL